MLHAGKALCGVVVLIVDMDVVVLDSLLYGCGEQIVVNEWFCGLARELHHHAGRGVGIHVRILACHIVVLGFDDLQEHVACLCATCYAALVAVRDITLGHILTGRFHQLNLHLVLNFLDSHAVFARHADAVGYLLDQRLILAHLCGEHGLADCCLDFLLIVSDYASVALHNCLYHLGGIMIFRVIATSGLQPSRGFVSVYSGFPFRYLEWPSGKPVQNYNII